MNQCPYCDVKVEVETVWDEIEHMNQVHPGIIAERLKHAGMEHLLFSKRTLPEIDGAMVERVAKALKDMSTDMLTSEPHQAAWLLLVAAQRGQP